MEETNQNYFCKILCLNALINPKKEKERKRMDSELGWKQKEEEGSWKDEELRIEKD